MRLLHLIFWDICFQIKYGIYMIYAILTVLYLVLLGALPPAWRTGTAVILIFSDPAAMGLFFMGAVILLEKSQRVVNALAVSPVTVREYIIFQNNFPGSTLGHCGPDSCSEYWGWSTFLLLPPAPDCCLQFLHFWGSLPLHISPA